MVLSGAHALKHRTHRLAFIAADTHRRVLLIRFERSVELLLIWTRHATEANVVVANVVACKKEVIRAVDFIVADVAVEEARKDGKSAARRSSDLRRGEQSFLNCMSLRAAGLRLLVQSRAAT